MDKSVKEYTKFVAEKLGIKEFGDYEAEAMMSSWGLKYNEEFETIEQKVIIKQLIELKRIIYGDSPDTHNLSGYKGLVKNQFTILLRGIGVLIK